ncbi:MAG: pyruvate dehydrogenase complex E1 component subunit beta [Proteobacteria bacterium]|nr:pyruvate dehydrogenase complex E1 component subunit beta [Pseudomonadota bacterium]
MAQMSFRDALQQAMAEEMARDSRVFLMGEEVAEYDGAYKVSKGLLSRFGEKRVVDTPISEAGFAGLGVGAAMAGLRPIIEMMTWNFGIQAFDQIINHGAKMRYMSGGQFTMPLVFRAPNGSAHMLSSQHSQYVEGMLTNIPGLMVVCPSHPADGKGLLKSSIRSDNCIIFLESEMMYGDKGEVPEGEHIVPLGQARIAREGQDVTLVSWGKALRGVMRYLSSLEDELGLSVEVIDLRTLQPLDEQTIFTSIAKTHRMVIVEEGWGFASVGAEIAALVGCHSFDELDAPIERLASAFVPMPYNEHLEKEVLPSRQKLKVLLEKLTYQSRS